MYCMSFTAKNLALFSHQYWCISVQIVHLHHISEVKHIDGYVTTYILCLVINIQIYVVVATGADLGGEQGGLMHPPLELKLV